MGGLLDHSRGTSHTLNPYFTSFLISFENKTGTLQYIKYFKGTLRRDIQYLSVAFDVSAGTERAKTALSSGSPLPPSVEVYFVWECMGLGGAQL